MSFLIFLRQCSLLVPTFQFPSEIQDVRHRFIFVPYVQDMERLRRDRVIAASIVTI